MEANKTRLVLTPYMHKEWRYVPDTNV